MRISFLLLLLLCFTNILCLAQLNDLSIGPAVSYHRESRKRVVNDDERRSKANLFGVGVKLQKEIKENLLFNIGLNYIKRHYDISVFYDHCYFAKDPNDCFLVLKSVGEYGYRTIEIPFGITKYLDANDKWITYININSIVAIDFQSYYNEVITNKANELHLFSGSIAGSLGIARRITARSWLHIEPFLRLINVQRNDPILFGEEKKWTFFDDFRVQLYLMFELL